MLDSQKMVGRCRWIVTCLIVAVSSQVRLRVEEDNINVIIQEMKPTVGLSFRSEKVSRSQFEKMKVDQKLIRVEEDIERIASSEDGIPWGVARVQALDAIWKQKPLKRIKVCVADTGYSLGHEDLPLDVIGNATVDKKGHGTHIAGTISALANGKGILGISNNIQLIVTKALNKKGRGTVASVLTAVKECIELGANIVSLSLGGEKSSEIERAMFKEWYDNNVLFLAAAGNHGTGQHQYPASYESVISVAGVNFYGERSWFSQYNSQVELAGPAESILSTYPNNRYKILDGTSMSVAHVSAAMALTWMYFPQCQNYQIRNAIAKTASNSNECNPYIGYGLVQPVNAYYLLQSNADCGSSYKVSLGGCQQVPITNNFRLTFLTDDYGEDTSFRVKKEQQLVLSGPHDGEFYDNNRRYTIFADLDKTFCYTFEFFDSYGDGLCCNQGKGWFTLMFQGNEIMSGDKFEYTLSTTFGNC